MFNVNRDTLIDDTIGLLMYSNFIFRQVLYNIDPMRFTWIKCYNRINMHRETT